jgi:hypothetical protein
MKTLLKSLIVSAYTCLTLGCGEEVSKKDNGGGAPKPQLSEEELASQTLAKTVSALEGPLAEALRVWDGYYKLHKLKLTFNAEKTESIVYPYTGYIHIEATATNLNKEDKVEINPPAEARLEFVWNQPAGEKSKRWVFAMVKYLSPRDLTYIDRVGARDDLIIPKFEEDNQATWHYGKLDLSLTSSDESKRSDLLINVALRKAGNGAQTP